MFKILVLVAIVIVFVGGCANYRFMYDTKSFLFLEEGYQKKEFPAEPYLTDANGCVKECIFFNATIIGFVINELALEYITPAIYRSCMEKKGYPDKAFRIK